jgi:Holliday junction resolvase
VNPDEARALMAHHQGQQPETAIKQQIRDYLRVTGWFVFPVLQGVGAYRGIPDMIATKAGQTVFLEVKTAKGKLSEHQEKFRVDLTLAGGRYVVARSVDDVIGMGET